MPNADLLSAMTKLLTIPPAMYGLSARSLDPHFVRDDTLQDALEGVVIQAKGAPDKTLEPHAFAVVDLTDNSNAPAYAGYRDTEHRSIASMAKLLALYAAFQWRSELRTISKDLGITLLLAPLGTASRVDYQRDRAATATRPRVEKACTIGAAGDVNFVRRPILDSDLSVRALDPTRGTRTLGMLGSDSALDAELLDLSFREHLRLMAGWSDDVSAAAVVETLGYPYLWALANRSGLFRRSWPPLTRRDTGASGPGGLFLGMDYAGTFWNRRPTEAPPAPNHAGTARSVAVLMTMLAQERLIDHEAHVAMREMLRKTDDSFQSPPRGEGSLIGAGLHVAGWDAAQDPWGTITSDGKDFVYDESVPLPPVDPTAPLAVSKIGLLGSPAENSDSLLVRTKRPRPAGGDVMITAVLVGLNNVDDNTLDLEIFGIRIAPKLAARHGAI